MISALALCLHLEKKMPDIPYKHTIVSISCRQHVDPYLVAAIIRHESRFRPRIIVRERDGHLSVGLMQIKLVTARSIGFRGNLRKLESPWVNIWYGVRYLKKKMRASATIWDAVAAYNAGIAKWRPGYGYRNNRYVRNVWRYYKQYTGRHLRTPSQEHWKSLLVRMRRNITLNGTLFAAR